MSRYVFVTLIKEFVFFTKTATSGVYTDCHYLSLDDALPDYIAHGVFRLARLGAPPAGGAYRRRRRGVRGGDRPDRPDRGAVLGWGKDRKSTRLNSSN